MEAGMEAEEVEPVVEAAVVQTVIERAGMQAAPLKEAVMAEMWTDGGGGEGSGDGGAMVWWCRGRRVDTMVEATFNKPRHSGCTASSHTARSSSQVRGL